MDDFDRLTLDASNKDQLESLLNREWLDVNHLGGYASSTVAGLNTRKYHGLLVAAVLPPVRRMVLLSRVEETVVCEGWSDPLACNEYPNSIYPRGDQSMRAFSHAPFPRWAYQGQHWTIEKSVQMISGKNTVVISYALLGGANAAPVELQLRPLFALRGIHELMYQWNGPLLVEDTSAGQHRIVPTGRTPEVFFAHDGVFELDAHWYLNTIYRREQERGYSGLEDLWNPGTVRWSLSPGQTVHFVCSTDPIDFAREIHRAERQGGQSASGSSTAIEAAEAPAIPALLRAADQFVLNVPQSDGSAREFVSAQYHWSPPSPRYSLMGFTGLFLVPRKFAAAKTFLLGMVDRLVDGVLPSAFSETGGPAVYNGVDTSLWFVNAVHQYLQYTGDNETVQKPLLDAVRQIIHWYRQGTTLGILADVDGLLETNQPGVPTTWMNAQADGWVVTPRSGKAVEVNALWYNAVRIAAELSERFGRFDHGEELARLASTIKTSFNVRFWNANANCCYDVIDHVGADPAIRPNQLLAISLPFPVLASNRFDAVLEKVRRELLTPYGPRTLAPSDHNYRGTCGGDVVSRDRAHHQGSVFPWLLGPLVTAYVKVHGRGEGARREAEQLLAPSLRYLRSIGQGQLCELFDGDAPHRPGGAIAASISVAEILRCYVEDVLNRLPEPRSASVLTDGVRLTD
jgi:predicted glycogen debranching enzyme